METVGKCDRCTKENVINLSMDKQLGNNILFITVFHTVKNFPHLLHLQQTRKGQTVGKNSHGMKYYVLDTDL